MILFQPALCNSYGPTGDIFEDVKIIGERQFVRAQVKKLREKQWKFPLQNKSGNCESDNEVRLRFKCLGAF